MNWNEPAYGAVGQNPNQQGNPMANMSPNQMEMCRLVCIILINFSMASADSGAHIDNYAHGGGLISGFLVTRHIYLIFLFIRELLLYGIYW